MFEIDGKRVDLVAAKEEVDLSLEPGDTPPPHSLPHALVERGGGPLTS